MKVTCPAGFALPLITQGQRLFPKFFALFREGLKDLEESQTIPILGSFVLGCFSREQSGLPRPHTLLCAYQPGPVLLLALSSRARKGQLSPYPPFFGVCVCVGGWGRDRGRRVGMTWKGLGLGFEDKDLGMFAGWESEVIVNRLVKKPQTPASQDS